jgi:DNA polymerase V
MDEGWLDLSAQPAEARLPTAYRMREAVRKWTGLPVSIGLGPTKVIAKLGSRLAKQRPDGVVDLTDPAELAEVLARTTVQDVWMVGPRRARALNQAGIYSALQLVEGDERWIKRHLHVGVLRLVYELRGTRALDLDQVPAPPRAIGRARAFGRPVTELAELSDALAVSLSRICEKLRARGRAAQVLSLSLSTNRYRPDLPQYRNSCVVRLPAPTNATPELVEGARAALVRLYRPGFAYQRVSVLVTDLAPASPVQSSWLLDEARRARLDRLMRVVDEVNRKFGRDTLRFASVAEIHPWGSRAGYLSQRFTTRWREIVVVYAL